MECNKEEAIRAREIAEKKMQSSDFMGAQRIAQKAQKLFPELENISQLLTVCEVHCSAQNKLNGSEMDWYGILQVERLSDAATIKKQYRKLALLLHPDKNKFAGAEAAFKIIGEAHRVLADNSKRSLYDMKFRVSVKTAEMKVPASNKNSFHRKQYAAASINSQNVLNSQSKQSNPSQQARGNTFWTCCSCCGTRFQYYIAFLNRLLRCQSCGKPFTALDLATQGVSHGSTSSQLPNLNQFPNQRPANLASQSSGGISSGSRFPVRFAGLDPVSKAGRAVEVGRGSKTEEKKYGHVDVADGKEGVAMPKSDAAKLRESGTSKNTSRKRRKPVAESSESFETGSSDNCVEDIVNDSNPTEQNSGLNGSHQPRRSSRQKQHVSYKENLSDDDIKGLPKRSKGSGLSCDYEGKVKEAAVNGGVSEDDKSAYSTADSTAAVDKLKEQVKRKVDTPLKESFQRKKLKPGECEVKGDDAAALNQDEKSYVDDDSELYSNVEQISNTYVCPDPDFSDFEKDKADGCFSVDQIWATYDPVDGMPRFYVRIRKVVLPGFKLRITWLEPNPDDQGEIDWCKNELPVACGKYKLGLTEDTIDRLMFSHQMHWLKGRGRFSYLMYPRKGETWALYRNWDISWSSKPESHVPYKFEFVEALSDFDEDVGIGVAYLARVKGFVCLFQQSEQHGIVSFQISPEDLYRFSHRIPSFRMTGEEREGVPKGSFELDPAALPTNIDELDDPGNMKTETKSADAEACVLSPKSPDHEVQPVSFKRIHTPKKYERDIERETSKLRSSREPNRAHENHSRTGSSYCMTGEDGSKDISHCNLTQPEGNPSPCQADERINKPKKHDKNDLDREALNVRRSPRDLSKKNSRVETSQCAAQEETDNCSDIIKDEVYCGRFSQSKGNASCPSDEKMDLDLKSRISNSIKISEAHQYDFNGDRSEDKFQVGQIWALTGLPKKYAQVKKIESAPYFRLHVAFLEACSPSKDSFQRVVCGTFEVKNGETAVLPRTSFSHPLRVEPIGKSRYEIYPRKGDVWAIYRNWNALKCSDLENGGYDIVEVLDDNDQSTTVVVLVHVNGSKSVYRAPRSHRSKTGIINIPRNQLARFSHQIPAIQLTGEEDSRLIGCWKLECSSIPGLVIYLD